METRTIVRARREAFWGNGIAVLVFQKVGGGKIAIGQPVEMKVEEINLSAERAPTLSLAPDEAQQLMDELWHCGLRPSEGTGSAGALAAVQAHLADTRKLVAKAFGVDL